MCRSIPRRQMSNWVNPFELGVISDTNMAENKERSISVS